MPTIQQLPQATTVNTTDELVLEQSGTCVAATVGMVLAGTQPQLTLASGTLLGRVSTGSGGPEPVGLGAGLSITNGQLVADVAGALQLVSPAFTGEPTAPTPAVTDASDAIATTAFVKALAQTQTVTLTGDVTGSGVVNAVAATLPAITTPGVYGKVTVNAKGQVIGGGTLLASDISGLARVAVTGSLSDLTGTLGPVDLSTATVVGPPGGVARSLSTRALDMFNVMDFGAVADGVTNTGAAINAAITAAAALPFGGEVYVPAGHYRIDLSASALIAKSGVVLRGAGRGKTVLELDDTIGAGPGGAGISNAASGGGWPAITDFHLRDITLQGMRGQTGTNTTTGAFLMSLTNITNISVQNCELLDSRGFTLGLFSGTDVMVRGNRVARSNADSIAVWDVANVIIAENQIEMSGDNSISVHTNDTTAAPLRSGIVIANNTITDGLGIHVLGAKSAIITGNVIRRGRSTGISVGFDPYFHQGNTSNFALEITNNLIEDVIDESGYVAGSVTAYYIWVGGSSKQAGTGASAPGIPVPGSGSVTALYGAGTGAFYANGQSNAEGGHSVSGSTPSPGGYWVRIEGNTLVRTLPAVAAWSQWGYGSALQVGTAGTYNGAITEAMLNHPGIHVLGALRHSRIARNIIQTTGTNGIEFDATVSDMDYDGLEITGNRIADFSQYGVFWPTSSVSNQRMRIADNDIDGDPYFRSSNRGPNGSWVSSGGNVGLYLAFLNGAEVEGNHFRNLGAPVTQGSNVMNVLRRNVVHCFPLAVGSNAGNQGVGIVPPAGPDFTHVIETCDPTDANYGKIKSATVMTSAAQPSTGTYVAGHVVGTASPGLVNGQPFLGWQRLTTGQHPCGWHGLGADLRRDQQRGRRDQYLCRQRHYCHDGCGGAGERARAVAMTLGAGTVNGHVITVKRFGAAMTLTATIDGAAGSTVEMDSASVKEAISLTWSAAFGDVVDDLGKARALPGPGQGQWPLDNPGLSWLGRRPSDEGRGLRRGEGRSPNISGSRVLMPAAQE